MEEFKFQGRKPASIQVSDNTLKESSDYGNASIIAVMTILYAEKHPLFKVNFDDTERYKLGDVRVKFEDELLLCLDAEIRDSLQFNKIFNLEWQARLSARPGLKEPSILLDEDISSLSDVYKKFYHIWFDENEAKNCFLYNTLPTKFVIMKYSEKVFDYFQDESVWRMMRCKSKDGKWIEELKSLVPYDFIKTYELSKDSLYRIVYDGKA